MARDIIDVYFDGLKKFISVINDRTKLKQVNCFFTIHDKDRHVAQRINERQIDMLCLLKETNLILSKHLCVLIYAIYSGEKQIVIKTPSGHLVFRITHLQEHNCYRLHLCTVTPSHYSHDRDFILNYKENS